MRYTDQQRVAKIIELTDKLLKYLDDNNITRDIVDKDETIRWTVTTPLYNIGEHAYNLSKEFKELNNTVPWNKISGLRHRLVHDYEDTNWDIVSDILFKLLPVFRKQLAQIDCCCDL